MFTRILDKLWDFFSSLKPLAFIFSALVLSTLFGSFIIQRPMAEEGQIERAYSPEVIRVLDFFGCFDLFHSPWFDFLIFLLVVNVLCASIEMAPRHLKLYRHIDPKLSLAAMRNQRFFNEIVLSGANTKAALQNKIASALQHVFCKPQIFESERELRFFVNKMRWSYLGVYIVHAGLIVIMIGGVWGSVHGFEGQMSLMEGQESNKVTMRNTLRRNKILDFSILCHDVRMDTYDDGSPKAYFSDLEVFDKNGGSVLRKTIRVNDPLVYDGIAFFQANYGKQKINVHRFYAVTKTNLRTHQQEFFNIPEDATEYAIPGTKKIIQVSQYQVNPVMPTAEGDVALGETLRFSYGNKTAADKNQKEFITVFKDYPEVDEKLRPNAAEVFSFQGLQEDFELKEVTGLQVARDPGAPVVFTGCALLVVGIFWAFFTGHQKIWILTDGQKLYVAGKAYRSPVAFQQKFEKLIKEIS